MSDNRPADDFVTSQRLRAELYRQRMPVSTRTLARWRKAGCPHVSFRTEAGRVRHRYEIDAVIAWRRERGRP